MNDLISREGLIKEVCGKCDWACDCCCEENCIQCKRPNMRCDFRKALDEPPTVDAVPVVHCKDCRYRNDLYVIGRAICNNEKGLMSTEIKDTDFCPYGERRVSDV